MNQDQELQNRLWWNRPLWGDKSMLEKLQQAIHQDYEQIPEEVIEHYHRVMGEVRLLAPIAKALDNEKFNNQEFIFFLKIISQFNQKDGELFSLKHYVTLFRVAIEAKNSFLKIEDIELFYRSLKQQEFYQFVNLKLEENLSSHQFIQGLEKKIVAILPEIKSEEGKQALITYKTTIEKVASQDELGLRLLYLFKKYELKDYSLLRIISDMIVYLQNRNLQDFNDMLILVQVNETTFEQLGRIIEIPLHKKTKENYAKMLQYVALRQKYQNTYIQFQRLVEILYQWHNFYEILIGIREQYPSSKFDQPTAFSKEIPGESIYFKYHNYFPYSKE